MVLFGNSYACWFVSQFCIRVVLQFVRYYQVVNRMNIIKYIIIIMVFVRGQCGACGCALGSAGVCGRCSFASGAKGLSWKRKRESVGADISPPSKTGYKSSPQMTGIPIFPIIDPCNQNKPGCWRDVTDSLSLFDDQGAVHKQDDQSDCWTPLTCPETDSTQLSDTESLSCDPVIVSIRRIEEETMDGSICSEMEMADAADFEDSSDSDRSDDEFTVMSTTGPGLAVGTSNVERTEPGRATESVLRSCLNCRRTGTTGCTPDNEMLLVTLEAVCFDSITKFEKRWKTFIGKKAAANSSIVLCLQCKELLSNDQRSARKAAKKTTPPWKIAWPVYMWKLLTHPIMLEKFGSDILHWVPVSCHSAWRQSLTNELPAYYHNGSFDCYAKGVPVMVDGSVPKRQFMGVLKRNRLGEIKEACDRLLVPRVLCPWGCSAYLHDVGSVPYDAVINRFFPFVEFAGTLSTKHQKAKVESARSDYLDPEIDMHLHNPDWSVHPTIEFTAELGPVVLTCDSHDGGTVDKYFHLPKTSCPLSSAAPDVLSHAVLHAKTVHRTKAFRYSTMYQMNKCQGSYSGIECSYITENRRFDFVSHLTDISEARSYAGRMDIRGLVDRLKRQRIIPEALAESYSERANDLFSDIQSLSNLSRGATMITLYDSIKLQSMLSTHPVLDITIDTDTDHRIYSENQRLTRSIRHFWPTNLIRIHPNDGYGSKLMVIPAMMSRPDTDLRIVWNLCHLLLCVPSLWEHAAMSVSKTSQWHGFLLGYLSKNVLKQAARDGHYHGDPFDVDRTNPLNKPCGLANIIQEYCKRKGNPEFAYPVDDFRPSDLGVIFGEEVCRGCVSVQVIAETVCAVDLSSRFAECPNHCDTFMLYRSSQDQRSDTKLPLEFVLPDGSKAELRFLSSSTTQARARIQGRNWKSSVWTRHGCDIFSNWWHATRSPSVEPCQASSLDQFDWASLDVAVYVRVRSVPLEQYRREYLKYIGGQTKVGCDVHDVPLITSQARNKAASIDCCLRSSGCNCKGELECPVYGCCTKICRPCFAGLEGKTMQMVGSLESPDSPGQECDSDSVTRNSDSSYDSSDDSSICGGVDGRSVDISGADHDSGSNLSCQDDMSDLDGDTCGANFSDLATGANCAGHGTGEFYPEAGTEDNDEEDHHPLIPTTIESEDENGIEGGFGVVGTSVLLNKCGTILVRRDTQLQATRRERNLLERVVARKDVGTVPLLYLEGILFPSIFWSLSHSADGGILGSMPTSLFCQNATRKRFGVASMADHAKTRLKSVSNSASTNPRYLTFMFDSLANGALEGQDTRVVLSRGFEESMGPAGMRIRNKGDDLYSDTIDNRQCVHDLTASERDKPADLFVTMTCNQREHFGIKGIKRYIDDGAAVDNYKKYYKDQFPREKPLSDESIKEVQKAFQEASITLTVRNWMEIRKILMRYILKSPELPMGSKVAKLFVRDEYQGDAGNISHLHMLITLEKGYDTAEGRALIQSLIRGFVDEIVGVDEVEGLIKEGLIENWEDYNVMKEQAKSFLSHQHSDRCMRRTGPGDYDLVCRVPDARLISKDITSFSENVLNVNHSANSIRVMERLGLCKQLKDTDGEFVPTREYLKAKRIYAPVRHGEGNITPVLGRFFAATRSSMNVQICTSNGTTRYVVKYLVKIDENNYVTFGATQQKGDTKLKAEKVFMCNTKVTSSAINEAKKLRSSRHRDRPRGRTIACTEMIQLILGFPQVHCNMEFIRVPTLPLGERPGLEKPSPKEVYDGLDNPPRDSFSTMVPSVMTREHLFKGPNNIHRLHTNSQILMLQDQMICPVTLDRVFLFGIRPPEILFIDKMEWYFRIFERSKHKVYNKDITLGSILSTSLVNSPLVDGLGHRLRIRPKAIPMLESIVNDQIGSEFSKSHAQVVKCIRKIIGYHNSSGITLASDGRTRRLSDLSRGADREWTRLQSVFVDCRNPSTPLPVVVFSNVKPYNASKFVIHLLLSMGRFITERDIWVHASMKDAFIASGLIKGTNGEIDQTEIDTLLRTWVEDQLRYYPIGTKKMDEYMVAADDILKAALLRDSISINELPPVMYTSLVQETEMKVERHLLECKEVLVDATLKTMSVPRGDVSVERVIPSRESLMSATKAKNVHWNYVLPRSNNQSEASYEEQLSIQQRMVSQIDRYCNPATDVAKNMLIAGPPGVGKTHCMGHGILYSLCRGLNVMTTAVLADRAFMLGGRHLHKLFQLRVRDQGSPHRLAELAVIALQRKPELLAFLRRLDVLFLDECGQVSAELLSILDIILRKIRNSNLFMGGILVIGTIDQVQLRPIKGLPFLLSPYVLTTFAIFVLKEYVRCGNCVVLQRMNELARSFPSTESEYVSFRQEMRGLIRNNCTFIDNWDDPIISDDVLRIFPRREETGQAIRRFLKGKRAHLVGKGKPYISVQSDDTMIAMESHAEWKSATRHVISYMNSKLKEPESVDFFEGAIYQFTQNFPGRYNATQLGILLKMPTCEQLADFKEIDIWVAPAGTKSIDPLNLGEMIGWHKTKVGIAPHRAVNMWSHGIKGARKQYSLRHHVASTIHSSIGHTVSKIATELGPFCGLWEKAMVVVLISRVSEARDLIFVGNKLDNINALMRGLSVRNQYDQYMNHIVQVLSSNCRTNNSSSPLYLSKHPFRQKDLALPQDRSGVVYLIVSVYEPSSFYIGWSQDMSVRMKNHNSGIGARESSDPSKRPWGLLAYVSGFDYDKSRMATFELRWQNLARHIKPQSAVHAVELAQRVIDRHGDAGDLNLIMAGDSP